MRSWATAQRTPWRRAPGHARHHRFLPTWMAEPFISPLSFTMTPALSSQDGHAAAPQKGLKVDEDALPAAPGLLLADHHALQSWHDL